MTDRVTELYSKLENCDICPQNCHVNRLKGKTGICKQSQAPKISSAFLHHGEEPPLVGQSGSGTIFFTGCNLKCVYCQNYEISHLDIGDEITVSELSNIMISLQSRGALNINLVSPSHQSAAIADALELAKERGLCIPVVYNCGGYESVETLRLLEGLIDIYMPDIKYFNDDKAWAYSRAKNYSEPV
ncbi:MAG: 4Fe-4S cluster-binding domain-containing protein, partial [Spirochaetota bacterium]|nr:4Fe-4S cluster-binding domain-containing protein [Spirochaetota bacterium]